MTVSKNSDKIFTFYRLSEKNFIWPSHIEKPNIPWKIIKKMFDDVDYQTEEIKYLEVFYEDGFVAVRIYNMINEIEYSSKLCNIVYDVDNGGFLFVK